MVSKKLMEKYVGSKIVKELDEQRGTIYEFKNGQEWLAFDNADIAEAHCIDYVSEQLSEEPELFNKDWLVNFFDTERFLREIDSDIENMVWEDIKYSPKDFGLKRKDAEDETKKFDDAVQEETQMRLDNIKDDPIDYLEGLGMEDTIYIYIDKIEAANDAVNTDGVAHFFTSYDGQEVELEDGTVMYRVN